MTRLVADEHDHEHDDEHDHGAVAFEKSHVDEVTLVQIRALHPALAENLILAQRYRTLSGEEKSLVLETQQAVETFAGWSPGFHDASDRCAACGSPATALFEHRFRQGVLAFAAFVDDVPVHARAECLESFRAKYPRRAPQVVDKLRREHSSERGRPSARMSQFFRHDVLKHGGFALEDWANSVAAANPGKLDRGTARDIERCIVFVHGRLFHARP